MSTPAPLTSDDKPREMDSAVEKLRAEEERPPQQEELLCTICGMRSCWREPN